VTIVDVVARHADSRSDMTLVDYVEVGLPAWRVLARCDVLEPKAISAIDETTMRAISLGVNDPLDLQILLGLDEQVLDTTLTALVGNEWARDAGREGKIALTEAGQEVLAVALEIVARELVVPFDYDGLLRRPILDQNLVDRRSGAATGLREVPAAPERPPDVAEVRGCRQAIARVLRAAGGRREQEIQLLDVRSIDRRDRYILPALAMVFAPRGRGRCEVALAIGDELSMEHEAAFVNAGLADRIALDRRLRSTQRRPLTPPGPPARSGGLNDHAEQAARRALREARECAAADGEATEELRRARAELNDLPVRTVQPHEHEALLRVALDSSRRRLLIAGGAVTGEHVDGRFLRRLRQTLDMGTLVRIVVSDAATRNDNALEALRTVARDYPGLIVDEKEMKDEGALMSDDRFVAYGAFPWLGQLGDRERLLTDTRSLLVRDREANDEVWACLDGRPVNAGERPQKPRDRRHDRSRRRQRRPRST
jgi:hypothetical protein